MKKFSIILPVRNGGELVKECVKSILSQTLDDFDLLVLDNFSSDGTSEWLKSLSDSRIKIYSSEKALTIEQNWNRIIEIPKGEFMTLIGHDDLLDENYLQETNRLIESNPSASLYQSHFRFVGIDGLKIRSCKKMNKVYNGKEYLKSILTDELDTMGTGYMMRSKDYDKSGGIPYYPNLLFADHALWIKLTSISKMVVNENETFSYRLNQSISKTSGAAAYIDAFLKFLDFIYEIGNENEDRKAIIARYSPEYIRYYCTSLAHRLLKTPIQERKGKTVSSFIMECKRIADKLSPNNTFHPLKQLNIRLAQIIDKNLLLQRSYFLFKKVYKRPIYS